MKCKNCDGFGIAPLTTIKKVGTFYKAHHKCPKCKGSGFVRPTKEQCERLVEIVRGTTPPSPDKTKEKR